MAFENRAYESEQAGMNRTTWSMSAANNSQSTDEKFQQGFSIDSINGT
jgi:hypothetical protein